VRLGRSNRRVIEVVDGVKEGDRLSPLDLAAPVAAAAARAGALR
jgi:hypothetical protein